MDKEKLMKLQVSQKDLYVEQYQKQSKRAVTLKDVWSSDEVSFKKMELQSGNKITRSILIMEVAKMVVILNGDMQELHIDYLVNYILQHYYSYTVSDITCLTDRLVKNNPYGKPILQNIIYELDQYSIEKQEFAVQQRIKENSLHKADKVECDRFYKNYQKMKEKAQEPVPTQKEKDMEAIKLNQEKLKELEKLYPDTDSEYLLRNM